MRAVIFLAAGCLCSAASKPLSSYDPRVRMRLSQMTLEEKIGQMTQADQGKSGHVTSGGTTILEAIRRTVSRATKVTFVKDGGGAAGADVGIVVAGETRYAEMFGDRADLRLAPEDLDALARVKQAGIPVVLILISERPLTLGEAWEKSDAIIAAWLPGTEGQGVADVLLAATSPRASSPSPGPRDSATASA